MGFTKGHKLGIGNQYARGRKHTDEWKEQARKRMLGNKHGFVKGKTSPRKGKKSTKPSWSKGLKRPDITGELHPNWIHDRTLIKGQDRKNNPEYKQWRKLVWERDLFKCKIGTENCSGRLEAHHIYRWSERPDLRYSVENGITLCHLHHPIKIKEEKILGNMFLDIIRSSLPRFSSNY